MIQEIKYNGFTANPSDYECPDGDLAMSVGLVPEDGALKPVLPPKVLAFFPDAIKVFLHKSNYTHYIVAQRTSGNPVSFKWADDGTMQLSVDAFLSLSDEEKLTDIEALGNVVIISTDLHMYYVLWKDDTYTLLGSVLPDIELRFSLSGHLVAKTHNNSGITFKEFASSDSSWNNIYTDYFSVELNNTTGTANSNTWSDNVSIPNVLLDKDTEYRFLCSGSGASSIVIWGTKADGSSPEEIITLDYLYQQDITAGTFKAADNWSNLYFVAWSGQHGTNISHHAELTITVQSGLQNPVAGKIIEYNSDNYAALSGAVNKFINEQATLENRFIYPFFVRYAIKLYDGSYAKISPPVLMIPNSGYVPFVNFKVDDDNLNLYAITADLEYTIMNSPVDGKWRNIIAGVDVFVSQSVWPYDQGKEFDASNNNIEYKTIQGSVNQLAGLSYGYCDFKDLSTSVSYSYNKYDLFLLANQYYGLGDTDVSDDWRLVQVAPVNMKEVVGKLRKVSNFYLYHSIEFDELAIPEYDSMGVPKAVVPDVDSGVLSSLTVRKALPDDFNTSCSYFDARMFVYNQRLNMCSFKALLANPVSPEFQNGYVYRSAGGRLSRMYVYIRTDEGLRIVSKDFSGYEYAGNGLAWFFYPNSRAYKAIMVYKAGMSYNVAELTLKPHDLLNGACWMADTIDDTFPLSTWTEEQLNAIKVNGVEVKNSSIYTSQVSNPFTFPAEFAVSLNCGRIMALSTAAKALSQGQFGQFPLYAFSTDGVWALEVSDTGTYSAKQPITRDVCINPDSITQIDSAVLFATDRGIMLISGSETVCLSESINSRDLFSLSDLPAADKLVGVFNQFAGEQERITLENSSLLPFREFLVGCRMIYDYTGQRILVYNPSVSYAYVYSLKSKTWGMIHSEITDNVNAYPDALAMVSGNKLVNFSTSDAEGITALIVTRPFKLGQPDVLKTIDTIIQRGYFRSGHVCQVLYGSRNLFDWHLLWSSTDKYLRGFRGSPYKYFRLALICKFDKAESAYGCSVQFTPRFINKPR